MCRFLAARGGSAAPVALVLWICAPLPAGARSRSHHGSGRPSTPEPRTVGTRLGGEATQIPIQTFTLLSHHPVEHVNAWGRDLTIRPPGKMSFFDMIGARATYGWQTGPYLVLGGFQLSVGYPDRRLAFSSTTAVDTGADAMLMLGLALPGLGIRAISRHLALGLEVAPTLSWYEYGTTLWRLADSATTSAVASATFVSLAVDAHVCIGDDNNGRFIGYCLVAAPIVAVWSPGDPLTWNAGLTVGLRIAVM
jgi:hypothetical protein